MLFSRFKINNYTNVLRSLLYGRKTAPTNVEPAPPIPVHITSPPFFALIIGINIYQHTGVTTLKGAVADADSIKEYLEHDLKVQKLHIRNLRNAQATRAAIIAEFQALETNPEIKYGDPILIYYAGHGGEVTSPAEWEAGSMTQMLIPHDYHTKVHNREVYGIPDHTIGALISCIAKAKGDNITVIFDCCFSGSGTRDDSTQLHRGIEITSSIPEGLDQEILDKMDGDQANRATTILPGFLHSGLRSHVLLAACGAREKAKEEQGRGIFTKALLDMLYTVSADTITYTDVLLRIHALPQQNPQCEGVNRGRILFNAKAPSIHRVFYKVRKDGDDYVMDAGAAHGINKGSVFAVYQDQESPPKAAPLGSLIIKEIGPFTTTMCLLDNAAAFALTDMGYALQTKVGEEEDLRLHIEVHDKLVPVLNALSQDMLDTGSDRRIISLVEKEKAELDIAISDGQVVFNILNPQITQFGLNEMPFRIQPTYDDIYPVLRAAAHYYWHLGRTNAEQHLQGKVQLIFTQVEEIEEYDEDFNRIIVPVGGDLNRAGVVDFVVDPAKMYGIKLINNSSLDLYPSLFYFDNSDLSITSYYQPPSAAQILDVPLPKMKDNIAGSLTIGYGSGGAVPFSYLLRAKQDVDVGSLKLFLTTEPVDYSNIPQSSPFNLNRADAPKGRCKPPFIWDTMLVTLVQRVG